MVLDFSQFLSGPSCGLRLADLGARVIKIEREGSGDLCRELYVSDTRIGDGESTIFHAINRNKESFSVNLKDAEALKRIKKLIESADVMLHNFRPGVMTKLGLDYYYFDSLIMLITSSSANPTIFESIEMDKPSC